MHNEFITGLETWKAYDTISDSTVKLGDFGTFSVNLKSEGAESEAALSKALINGVKMIFRPGKVMKQALSGVTIKNCLKFE